MEHNKLSYEEAIEELQNIMEKLESRKYTLDESITMFKKAMELYNYCSDILTKMDGEIKVLLELKDSLVEQNFLREEDDCY